MKLFMMFFALVTVFSSQSQAGFLVCKTADVDSNWNAKFKAVLSDDKTMFNVTHGEDLYAALDCNTKYLPKTGIQPNRPTIACGGSNFLAIISRTETQGQWLAEVRKQTSKTAFSTETLICREVQY